MTRLDHFLMDKSACGNFRPGESWARYLCIWRCQNRYEGANDLGDTVEKYLDKFYGLGTLRFHGLLSFHLDFQLQKLLLALKTDFWTEMQSSFYQIVVRWCSHANRCWKQPICQCLQASFDQNICGGGGDLW
jgi:hypothetical protein